MELGGQRDHGVHCVHKVAYKIVDDDLRIAGLVNGRNLLHDGQSIDTAVMLGHEVIQAPRTLPA